MTLEQLVERFYLHPSYLETGSPKLSRRFGVDLETINKAKQQVRNVLKEKIEPVRSSISLKEFASLIGIDMDSTETSVEQIEEDVWEEKVKWVKTKESSRLFVKKTVTDYKEEFDNFLNTYSQSTKTAPSVDSDKVLLVYMSDKHIGAKTKEDSLFENNWGKKEFEERMSALAKEIISLHAKHKFLNILLFDLGDSVDGFNAQTTRGGHLLPQNMSNREVFSTFLEVHTNFFYTLVENCKDVEFSFITVGDSNHGGDFEWICNRSLETVLNLKFPQIQTYIGDKFVEHFELGDHCFIICHGKDSEDLKFPLPQVLNEKVELYFKRYIDHHNINSTYIHVIKGDMHLSSCQYGKFFRYKNVLSMYGSSKWLQTNFMTNTKGVSMDILSDNSIMEYNLFL